jgi:hypothetical protein
MSGASCANTVEAAQRVSAMESSSIEILIVTLGRPGMRANPVAV